MGELASQPLETQVPERNGQVHGVAEGAHEDAIQVQRAGSAEGLPLGTVKLNFDFLLL